MTRISQQIPPRLQSRAKVGCTFPNGKSSRAIESLTRRKHVSLLLHSSCIVHIQLIPRVSKTPRFYRRYVRYGPAINKQPYNTDAIYDAQVGSSSIIISLDRYLFLYETAVDQYVLKNLKIFFNKSKRRPLNNHCRKLHYYRYLYVII